VTLHRTSSPVAIATAALVVVLAAASALGCSKGTSSQGDGGGVSSDAAARDAEPRSRDASLIDDVYTLPLDAADAFWVSPKSDAGQMQPPPRGAEWLHVDGPSIVDPHGNAVRLFGVNRSGTEYACVQGFGIFDGPSDAASIQAIQSWHANAVRVPLNEDCWLGINGVAPEYGGGAYQKAIAAYVELLLENGVYPIVDLHWSAPGGSLATGQQAMPDADHSVTFWREVATTFRDQANVILELFNEPWPDNNQDTDEAWQCWENGGACSSISYTVAGMQTLVTTVRETGAGNLLLLGGVEYSNGLSQWAKYKPTDPANNLAAAWHIYPENPCYTETCWNGAPATLAMTYPIVATEVGDSDCDGTFPTSVMTFLDARSQSYLGWTWDTFGTACGNYSLVTDYNGTPNGAYGMAFKTHFAGVAP